MKSLLVIADDPLMLQALSSALRPNAFSVLNAPDAETGLELAAHRAPEAVLLDIGPPDADGIHVLRALRTQSSVPVIVISGRIGAPAAVEALDAGADDYVTKPFAVEELAARLRAVLRRPGELRLPDQVGIGPYTADLAACTLTRTDGTDSKPVHLTPTEWRLLTLLLRNPGRLVASSDLLAEVWGPERLDRTNYLRVYLAGLRRKLEPDPAAPRHLITEPGLGYRFQP